MSADKMRHDLDRIMLEGNTAFQKLRLRADALEEENKRLREALLELVAYAKPFMRDEWQEQALTRARAALESK